MEVVARERWYMLVIKAKFAGTLCACFLSECWSTYDN